MHLKLKLLSNIGKLSLAKGIATFVSSAFLPKLANPNQKIQLIELF